MFTTWRMRRGHLDFLGQLKQSFAPAKHLVDLLLGYAVVDEIGKSNISASTVKLFAHLSSALSISFESDKVTAQRTSEVPSPNSSKSMNGIM